MATLIYDVDDLQDMQNNLSEDYELANDIDASATAGWPGGFVAVGAFTGTFDGKGFTISNLTVGTARGGYGGLFSSANASIQNLKLVDVSVILPAAECGALLGFAYSCTFSDCEVSGVVTGKGAINGGTGGFVGRSQQSTYTDCKSACTVTIDSDRAGGGFVGGFSSYYDNTFTRCRATGNVTGGCWIGGFVGTSGFYSLMEATFNECYATGNVIAYGKSGSGCYAGGFVGHVYEGTIKAYNCYARGSVNGTYPGHPDECAVGGFLGGGYYNYHIVFLDNCYSTGLVTGDGTYMGGFCGRGRSNYSITDCFWDQETSGQLTSGGGTGQTTLQMKTQSTFTDAGWDFDTIWRMKSDINDGYPYLEWSKWLLTIYDTAGGTVVTPGTGIFGYELDEVVDLLAVPGAERSFVEWTGDVSTIDNTNDAETTIVMQGNYTITANFSGAGLYPTGDLTRVSSIRRIFRPGMYRMEVALGAIGFEWDMPEVAEGRAPEESKEPEIPVPGSFLWHFTEAWKAVWDKPKVSGGTGQFWLNFLDKAIKEGTLKEEEGEGSSQFWLNYLKAEEEKKKGGGGPDAGPTEEIL